MSLRSKAVFPSSTPAKYHELSVRSIPVSGPPAYRLVDKDGRFLYFEGAESGIVHGLTICALHIFNFSKVYTENNAVFSLPMITKETAIGRTEHQYFSG